MGFNKVYRSLQEIFPQIDARALRAVAIEHSKDTDAAVEAVLVEIIPFFTERSRPGTPLAGSIGGGEPSEASVGAAITTQTADGPSVNTLGLANGHMDFDLNGENAPVGAVVTTQTADDPSVNTLGSADGHVDFDLNGENAPIGDVVTTQAAYGPFMFTLQPIHSKRLSPIFLNGDGSKSVFGTCHEYQGERNTAESALSEEILDNTTQTNADVSLHTETDVLIDKDDNCLPVQETAVLSADKCPESGTKFSSDNSQYQTLATLQNEDIELKENIDLSKEREEYDRIGTIFGTATNKESDKGNSWEDGKNLVVGPASLTVRNPTTNPIESSVQLVAPPDMHGSDLEELGASLSTITASKMETTCNIVENEDNSTLNASISQSSQIRAVDVLEEIISNARNNKKTLFSEMELVISLMREVELKEQAAEQAKLEAVWGGTDILIKLEELKQRLQQSKEANDMHAGEVYGEKAILTTELRELQSRVLSLSHERDKSLDVLDEMHQTLKGRLAAAENEIRVAEQEKIEKEKAAMEALAEQQLIMEKVVEESKILKKQAEENAKLQEFLMDRGRVVDMLQGEIAVICQDVRLLKEKFDENVPFSKSLSSSQTSCILASSSTSSSKSLTPELVESVPADSSETQNKRALISSSHGKSSEDEAAGDDRKGSMDDDGWELFDI